VGTQYLQCLGAWLLVSESESEEEELSDGMSRNLAFTLDFDCDSEFMMLLFPCFDFTELRHLQGDGKHCTVLE
jgi:hypothetical protein